MGYGDGPRVKCRSEVGKQMQSSRPKAQGGLDQGQTQGSGWSRGSTLEDQQAGLGSRTRARVRRWAPRTQGWRGCDANRGSRSGRGDISFFPDGIPSCWARGPWVIMSSTPCLGPGCSLHLGPSSSLRGGVLTGGKQCGSVSPPGPQ